VLGKENGGISGFSFALVSDMLFTAVCSVAHYITYDICSSTNGILFLDNAH
jgi:hypothetical protein